MNFLDLFSGIGGFRLGLEIAGHTCIGHCEKDKYANLAYNAMHKPKEGEWFAADITTIKPGDIPRADIWTFGFPCQDISIAGRQKGLEGTRSGLFYKVIELLKGQKEKDKPSILLIENVKNLLSVSAGWDFARVLIALDEVGYDAEWQVINSTWWVPQNRERIFVVGHLRGRSTSQVFPIAKSSGIYNESREIEEKLHETALCLTANGQTNLTGSFVLKQLVPGSDAQRIYDSSGIARTLKAKGGGQGAKTGLYRVGNSNPSNRGISGNVYDCLGIAPALTASDYKSAKKVIVRPVLTPNRLNKRQNGRRMKDDGQPMFTITASEVHGIAIKEATAKGYSEAFIGDGVNLAFPESTTRRGRVGKQIANTLDTSCYQGVVTEEYRIRRLTPLECFRLQGFPDEYFNRAAEAGLSDTRLYKCAGNSVTVNPIYEIGLKLRLN
jgi:DNA (cytosine-5)-methyltransferase 1